MFVSNHSFVVNGDALWKLGRSKHDLDLARRVETNFFLDYNFENV
jgi:hypothetical protein